MTLTPTARPASAPAATLLCAAVEGPFIAPLGPSAGRNASLVRVSAQHPTQKLSVQDILDRLPYAPLALVTGDPMYYLNRPALVELVEHLAYSRWRVELETNGTIPPTGPNAVRLFERGNVMWTVRLDPLLHEGDTAEQARARHDSLVSYADLANAARAVWLMTVRGEAEAHKALALADRHRVDRRRVWLTPPDSTSSTALDVGRRVAGLAAAEGVNLTLSAHALLNY